MILNLGEELGVGFTGIQNVRAHTHTHTHTLTHSHMIVLLAYFLFVSRATVNFGFEVNFGSSFTSIECL